MQKFVLLALYVLASQFTSAQNYPVKDSAIQINNLKFTISATAYSATTLVELELLNPNTKVMDGEINFSLAGGQIINDFKLDINGQMRAGVTIEKQQARVAYENIVRQKVDPGLLEMTKANQYRIRVYPMPALGKRFVSFQVQQLLIFRNYQADYLFPVKFTNPVKKLSAEIAVHSNELPFTTTGFLAGKTFTSSITKQLSFQTVTVASTDLLLFSIPVTTDLSLCTTERECEQVFLARIRPDSLPITREKPSSVTVFWDVSASAMERNLAKEMELLEAYLHLYEPLKLTIITFAVDVVAVETFSAPGKKTGSIKRFLSAQKADGGTRFSRLNCSQYPADEYWLFSDGRATFGEGGLHTNEQPLFTVQSSVSANTGLLNEMARSTGGKRIDISLQKVEDAISSLQQPQWKPLISKKQKELFDLQVLEESQSFLIKGVNRSNADSIVVAFTYGRLVQQKIVYLNNSACHLTQEDNAVNLIEWQWANSHVKNLDSLHHLAMDRKIVTTTTSFIVLDAVDDYYQFGITPPKELLEEFKRRYPSMPNKKEESKREKEILVYNKLKQSVDEYNEKVRWWNPNLTALHLSSPTEKKKSFAATDDKVQPEGAATNNLLATKANALSEVVVVGYSTTRRREMAGSVSSISANQISSSATVQQALQGRVSGLHITGSPGASTNVSIRGAASIRGGGEPLYILDGMRVDAATVMNMSTFDIENISVLKDAASAATYGSGAANGVIVVTTKKGKFAPPVKQVEEEENFAEELLDSVKEVSHQMRYNRYHELKHHFADNPSFYFRMADYFFQQKLQKEALRILSNLAEVKPEDHQLLRTIGYVLEEWNDYANAIEIYKAILKIKEEEPQSYRDLAIAYAMNGNRKEAVELLYKVLSKDWGLYENRYQGLREIMMTELNAIVKDDTLAVGSVNKNLLQLLPVDLRVVIDWNKDETDIDLHVVEPSEEECSYSHRNTKAGGRISRDFTQGYGPEQYEIKTAAKGTYKIKVNYYGDRYQKQQVPSFIKLTVFRNYGKANQTVFIKTIKLDGEERMIDLAQIKF